ncbi:MAG: glycosyltransferase [bacterium]|nr:glycosyltransferase [bacterium]
MKIAIVHDWLLGLGGAERTLKVFHEMFPEAPIYTFFHNEKFTKEFLPQAQIKPSALQKWYNLTGRHRWLLPFLPMTAEAWDFSEYDLVISSSIAFSKGLVLKPRTKHLSYCYSPTRFLWDWNHEYEQRGWVFSLMRHFLRIWDRQSSHRVDQFVAISKNVQSRIKKYYGRDSTVIYPPLTLPIPSLLSSDRTKINRDDYFLIVSRLFPHKNIEIAIEAFNKLGWPLVIVGSGPEYKRLRAMITNPSKIRMVGEVTDTDLATYYLHAKAFILPQEEDFGLTPLEAMSYGKPVLALRRGGALEYILEGINGEFFDDPHPATLADGARRLSDKYAQYSPLDIKKTAERFSRERFEEEMGEAITEIRTSQC